MVNVLPKADWKGWSLFTISYLHWDHRGSNGNCSLRTYRQGSKGTGHLLNLCLCSPSDTPYSHFSLWSQVTWNRDRWPNLPSTNASTSLTLRTIGRKWRILGQAAEACTPWGKGALGTWQRCSQHCHMRAHIQRLHHSQEGHGPDKDYDCNLLTPMASSSTCQGLDP